MDFYRSLHAGVVLFIPIARLSEFGGFGAVLSLIFSFSNEVASVKPCWGGNGVISQPASCIPASFSGQQGNFLIGRVVKHWKELP